MAIEILLNDGSNHDVTSQVIFGTLRKVDNINEKVDTLSFDMVKIGDNDFLPEIDQTITLTVDNELLFAGRVTQLRAVIDEAVPRYSLACVDWRIDLNRLLVVEGYTNQTGNAIIADLLANYAPEFGNDFVECPIKISSVDFNRISVAECLDKLAKLTGYSWYVDYNKKIHFFEKNSEPASVNITDSNGIAINGSLNVIKDLSQLRNRIFVRGGEIEGVDRTEYWSGDGTKVIFPLATKFAKRPTVKVNGNQVNVGVDFLDIEDNFDCFWSYQQKSLRFKADTVPSAGTNNIEITGTPLFPLVMQVEQPDSVAAHGIREYAITDINIKSRDEAKARGVAELMAYKDGLIEGSFMTYEPGFRAGQTITVQSGLLDVNERYLIQSVRMSQEAPGKFIYQVQLATLRTIGIVQFMIDLLKSGRRDTDSASEVLEKTIFTTEQMTMTDSALVSTEHEPQLEYMTMVTQATVQALDYAIEFVLGEWIPTDTRRVFILNGSRLG